MRFTSIKHGNGTTELAWNDHMGDDTVSMSLSSDDTPHPGFTAALEAIRPKIPRLIGAPKEYADGVEVRGLRISYAKGDRRTFVIHAIKPVELTNGPFNINTPPLLEPDLDSDSAGQAPQDFLEAFEDLLEQARLFARGRREQTEMFDASANGEQPKQTESAAERALEIDRFLASVIGERPTSFENFTEKEVWAEVLGAFDERMPEGLDTAQFSHLKQTGIRRVRCAIGRAGGVPQLWYGIDGRFNPETMSATLLGEELVTAVKRLWADVDDEAMQFALEQPARNWKQWWESIRPTPAPSGTVTVEVSCAVLHAILSASDDAVASLFEFNRTGAYDEELLDDLRAGMLERSHGQEKYSFSHAIGIESSDNVEYVAVDVVTKYPPKITVKLSNRKKHKLESQDLALLIRGMCDIDAPSDEDALAREDAEDEDEIPDVDDLPVADGEPNPWPSGARRAYRMLTSVPADDTNFKGALEDAPAWLIERALRDIDEKPKQRTRTIALRRRLSQLHDELREEVPV